MIESSGNYKHARIRKDWRVTTKGTCALFKHYLIYTQRRYLSPRQRPKAQSSSVRTTRLVTHSQHGSESTTLRLGSDRTQIELLLQLTAAMSSSHDDDPSLSAPNSEKQSNATLPNVALRKQNVACDACRQKKVRCQRGSRDDVVSGQFPSRPRMWSFIHASAQCTQCQHRGSECTSNYIDQLQNKVKKGRKSIVEIDVDTSKKRRRESAADDCDAQSGPEREGSYSTTPVTHFQALSTPQSSEPFQ